MGKKSQQLSSLFLVFKKEDQDLVDAFKNGHEKAFETLYNRYRDSIYSFIKGMLKDEQMAQDVVQDTFIRAHSAIPGLNQDVKFKSWLYTIAKNRALDLIKKKDALQFQVDLTDEDQSMEDLSVDYDTSETHLIKKSNKEILEKCIEKLTSLQKVVLLMRIHGEFNYNEIADAQKLTVSSVKSALNKAKNSISDCVQRFELKGTGL